MTFSKSQPHKIQGLNISFQPVLLKLISAHKNSTESRKTASNAMKHILVYSWKVTYLSNFQTLLDFPCVENNFMNSMTFHKFHKIWRSCCPNPTGRTSELVRKSVSYLKTLQQDTHTHTQMLLGLNLWLLGHGTISQTSVLTCSAVRERRIQPAHPGWDCLENVFTCL